MSKALEKFQEKTNIHLQSFIIGMTVFTVIASLGFIYKIDLNFPISAIGLIYLGYNCKSLNWGILLGAISTIPLIIITLYYNVMTYTNTTEVMIIIISLSVTGAIVSSVGVYLKISRKKAIAEANKKEKIGKNKKKSN